MHLWTNSHRSRRDAPKLVPIEFSKAMDTYESKQMKRLRIHVLSHLRDYVVPVIQLGTKLESINSCLTPYYL